MKKPHENDTHILRSQISKAERYMKGSFNRSSERKNVFSGFSIKRLAHLLNPWVKEGKWKSKTLRLSQTQDGASKCYDSQDLHLYHLRKIMHEKKKELSKRYIWGLRLPKAKFDRLYLPGPKQAGPITERLVIPYPFEQEPDLEWEKARVKTPDRPYILTRIAEIYPQD